MTTKTAPSKVELLNPNTGGTMNINKEIYDLFSKTIYHILKSSREPLTFSEIVEGVHDCFKEKKTGFKGSVEWYAISVKNDMHARGVIEVFMEKRKKLHRIKK
jgi:hypothetical protein